MTSAGAAPLRRRLADRLRPRAAAVLWIAGLSLLTVRVGLALTNPGEDFRQVWIGVDAFLRQQSPYDAHRVSVPPALPFVYPPSSLLLLAPVATVGLAWARPLFIVVDGASILLAGFLCLRLLGVPLTSVRAALMPAALALFAPVTQTLYAGNVNGLVVAGEAAALLAASRQRWLLAGGCLGVTLAIKPVLVPLLLLPVLAGRWGGALVAALIPVLLSALAAPLMVEPGLYVTKVLPLLAGSRSPEQSVALSAAGALLGLPHGVTTVLRGVVLALAAVALWRRWRRPAEGPRRLIDATGILVTATLLCSSFAWGHYGIYLLPVLFSAIQGGAPSGWLGAAAFYCLGGPDVKLWVLAAGGRTALWQLRVTAGLLLALAGLGRAGAGAARRDRA